MGRKAVTRERADWHTMDTPPADMRQPLLAEDTMADVYNPTPDEIAKACREFQSGWTPAEIRQRVHAAQTL